MFFFNTIIEKSYAWVPNPQPAKLYYADPLLIWKLCICYKKYTVIYMVRYTNYWYFSTCSLWTSP